MSTVAGLPRRGLAAALGLAVVAPAALAADPGPDAELIRMCAAVVAIEADWRVRLEVSFEAERQGGYAALVQRITDTPALTEAGNRAKLAVALSYYAPDVPKDCVVDGLLWDAVEALAAMPSGGAA